MPTNMQSERPEIVVVGMGNVLYHDEGVGVYAAHYLRGNYRFRPAIEVLDGAMLGFALMDHFRDGVRLLVLDALLADDAPGTVYRLPSEQLLSLGSDTRPTAHEVDPITLLKQSTLLGVDVEVVLAGIVPAEALEMRLGLTEEVQAGFPAYIGTILEQLDAWGIAADPVDPEDAIPLDEVMQSVVAGAATAGGGAR